jgi:acetyltransferase-like isoleucine patch superfamily enzyme
MRKILSRLLGYVELASVYMRRKYIYIRMGARINHVGTDVRIVGYPLQVSMGPDSSLYDGVRMVFSKNGQFIAGSHLTISYRSLVECRSRIEVGSYVMIGEFCSIRDTAHSHLMGEVPFCKQSDYSLPIRIGSNVWIGRGTIILPGVDIGDNVVIGANSVVRGKLRSGCLYAGVPAKYIKNL